MDFTQAMSDEEEGEEVLHSREESIAGDDNPACCPICSYVWTSKDCALSREIHVNRCLEKVGETQPAAPGETVTTVVDHPTCPICHAAFDSIALAENHINLCLDASCTADQVTEQEDALKKASTASRCPICVEVLPEAFGRRVRHIKACAAKTNVTGPRDLDGSDYQGMLDVLIEQVERVEEEEHAVVIEEEDGDEDHGVRDRHGGRKTVTTIKDFFSSSSSATVCRTPLLDKSSSVLNALRSSATSSTTKRTKVVSDSAAAAAATVIQPVKPWHTCPHWKRIPGSSIIVDGFEYAHPELSSVYFLSHFHYDHYIGLTRHFNAGIIHCGPTTGRLVQTVLQVNPRRIKIIPLGERTPVTDDVYVTLLDANHAPGSCVMLFENTKTKKLHVHTGDFRANEELAVRVKHLACQLLRPVEALFLDTTYCNPQYDFLPQSEVIRHCKEMIEEHARTRPRLLVLFGAYTIGKERIAMACLPANKKLAVSKQKMAILRCYDMFSVSELSRFTTERSLSSHWIVGMNELDVKKVEQMRKKSLNRFDSVLAVRATGWVKTFKLIKETEHVSTLFVPYSEHSSFSELKQFVRIVNPKQVVPTVMSKGMTKEEMLRVLMY